MQFYLLNLDTAARLAQETVRTAERYHLGLLRPAALVVESSIYALQLRFDDMERTLTRVYDEYPQSREHIAIGFGFGESVRALLLEDRTAALAYLDRAYETAAPLLAGSSLPFLGLWSLMRTIAGVEDAFARETVRAKQAGLTINAALLTFADAAALGRAGRSDEALAAYKAAERRLAPAPWFLNVARRYLAEAALDAGWGDPVLWLRDAEAFFDQVGHESIASACRALLRRAGASVVRRRGSEDAAEHLRRLGITAREADVLAQIVDGRSNREIAERLVISRRTVEKHVEMLLAKTGTTTRAQLVTFALRQAESSR